MVYFDDDDLIKALFIQQRGDISLLAEVAKSRPHLLKATRENGSGYTLLHHAASIKCFKATLFLCLRQPELCTVVDTTGNSALHILCGQVRPTVKAGVEDAAALATLMALLATCPPSVIELRNNSGRMPLYLAQCEWLKKLLENFPAQEREAAAQTSQPTLTEGPSEDDGDDEFQCPTWLEEWELLTALRDRIVLASVVQLITTNDDVGRSMPMDTLLDDFEKATGFRIDVLNIWESFEAFLQHYPTIIQSVSNWHDRVYITLARTDPPLLKAVLDALAAEPEQVVQEDDALVSLYLSRLHARQERRAGRDPKKALADYAAQVAAVNAMRPLPSPTRGQVPTPQSGTSDGPGATAGDSKVASPTRGIRHPASWATQGEVPPPPTSRPQSRVDTVDASGANDGGSGARSGSTLADESDDRRTLLSPLRLDSTDTLITDESATPPNQVGGVGALASRPRPGNSRTRPAKTPTLIDMSSAENGTGGAFPQGRVARVDMRGDVRASTPPPPGLQQPVGMLATLPAQPQRKGTLPALSTLPSGARRGSTPKDWQVRASVAATFGDVEQGAAPTGPPPKARTGDFAHVQEEYDFHVDVKEEANQKYGQYLPVNGYFSVSPQEIQKPAITAGPIAPAAVVSKSPKGAANGVNGSRQNGIRSPDSGKRAPEAKVAFSPNNSTGSAPASTPEQEAEWSEPNPLQKYKLPICVAFNLVLVIVIIMYVLALAAGL